MNDKSSSVDSKSESISDATKADQNKTDGQPNVPPAPSVAESVNSKTEHQGATESEEETDRKQNESIASLAEQTTWIAKQTKWIRYQVVASTFLGAVTLGVLIYHGWVMRRQSQAMTDQTAIMKGQLESMNSASGQTQQMIAAMQKQANAAASQAGTSQALAEQNKDLVGAAVAQAAAARKSTEIAQQSFYIGDRPYVSAKNVVIDKFEPGVVPTITTFFENNGKTPALDIQFGVLVTVDKQPQPDLQRYIRMSEAELIALDVKHSPYKVAMPYGSKVFLAAGEKTFGDRRGPELTPSLIDDIKNEKLYLLVWGGSVYTDGLGRAHRLKFCFFYDPRDDTFVACANFNSTQ